MKKLLLTLIVSLACCGSIFAQYESHWPTFYYPDYADQTPFVAAIELDGEIVTAEHVGWDALEIAFFVGEQCRGAGVAFGDYTPSVNYLYNGYVEEYGDPYPTIDGAPVYYNTANEVVTVRMYDHLNDIEYNECTVTYQGNPYEILTGGDNIQGWFDPEDIIILHFTTPATGEPSIIEGGYWNVEATWQWGEIPENIDVIINDTVIIPSGYVAQAHNITINPNSALIIEDGGELIHTGEVELTMQMNLEGYNPSAKDGAPEWRLIASPITSVSVASTGLVPDPTDDHYGNVDLYMFDQSCGGTTYADGDSLEWRNYKAGAFDNLVNTKGYLYANTEDAFVVFAGQTIATVETPVNLVNDETARFKGWNLLGNPFTCKAYVDMPYYVLNSDGSEISNDDVTPSMENAYILPMRGIFVRTMEGMQEDKDLITTCNFNITQYQSGGVPEEKSIPHLSMNVMQDNNSIDLAYMRFDGGRNLDKFQLNENRTKIYMPENGKDYAILSSGDQGTQPVNFVAEHNGSYTIKFTAEEVSFNYLHLIDNMTGADVDLLANPSYTFNAKTTDYASRFKLVFATGNNSNDDNFAFMSNGNLVINNEGKATVQVIDVTGRILSSESINGSASINIDAAAGVYMIRLINGNDVKVQKMVVR